ncbi:MAG: heparinase II/III domain-containing protein [Armatimonadota bacterium]
MTRWLMLALLLCGLQVWAADPVFPPHPRLQYTAAELAAWKADPARKDEVAKTIAAADGLLAKPLQVPQKSGDWIFYYACPDDDATLRAETPEKHVCPRCGKVYTDERTCAAYRTQLNYQIDRNCRALALAYALTGDAKYARPVRDAMLEMARLYPTFERHDRWGRKGPLASIGGWRYAQLLDEAVALIDLSQAYDLIAGGLTVDERKTIEEKLLGYVARNIQQFHYFSDPKNNHRTWFNAAYANVGVAIGDNRLLDDAINAQGGLLWQLDHSITADGIWYEGTMAYHFYALQAVQDTLNAVRRAGWTFADNAKLKSLWLGPMQSTYPNGAFPVINDSDPGNLRDRAVFYRWAYEYFKDARFAELAGVAKAGEKAPLASADLAGIGLGVLRRQNGDNPLCTMIDYGIHGGGHGHPDKLGIVLFGLGQELVLDNGRISYSVPEYRTWCRTTVAHNTVVIDGKNQQEDTGRMLFFQETPQYTAALAASDGAYPGYALRRFLVLADNLLIDVFAVRGEKKAQIDWLLHSRGTPTTDLPMAERTEPLGLENGYQHLKELKQGGGAPAVAFTFMLDGGKFYRVHCPGDADSTLVTGIGIGYHLADRVPFLLRRREAASIAFVTVYDLSGTQTIDRVERLPLTLDGKPMPETDGVGLLIRTTGGIMRVGLDLRDTPEKSLKLNGMPIERCLFF